MSRAPASHISISSDSDDAGTGNGKIPSAGLRAADKRGARFSGGDDDSDVVEVPSPRLEKRRRPAVAKSGDPSPRATSTPAKPSSAKLKKEPAKQSVKHSDKHAADGDSEGSSDEVWEELPPELGGQAATISPAKIKVEPGLENAGNFPIAGKKKKGKERAAGDVTIDMDDVMGRTAEKSEKSANDKKKKARPRKTVQFEMGPDGSLSAYLVDLPSATAQRLTLHKVHTLSLAACLVHRARWAADLTLQATLLSLIPSYYAEARIGEDHDSWIKRVAGWLCTVLCGAGVASRHVEDKMGSPSAAPADEFEELPVPRSLRDVTKFLKRASKKGKPGKGKPQIPHRDTMAILMVALLTSLGVNARLCASLFPISAKEPRSKPTTIDSDDDNPTPVSPTKHSAPRENLPPYILFPEFVSPDRTRLSVDLSAYSPPFASGGAQLGPSPSFFTNHLAPDSPYTLACDVGEDMTWTLEDVTERYFHPRSSYLSKIPRLRTAGRNADPNWMYPLLTNPAPNPETVDESVKNAGFPTRLQDFKGHPLYALERHLTVNEVIYPPGTPSLGLAGPKSEPVYPRSAVHTVLSKEKWLREHGRVVKDREKAAKWVKARKKVTIKGQREEEVQRMEWEEEHGPEEVVEKKGKGKASKGKEKEKEVPKKKGKKKRVVDSSDSDEEDWKARRKLSDNEEDEEAIVLSSASEGDDRPPGPNMKPLYGRWQTELYEAPPVVDGQVPKNNFGNIDLYHPSMLPAGAAHIPGKALGRVAKQLGVDYADAVVAFEFRRGRAIPVQDGIVVPANMADVVKAAAREARVHKIDVEEKKRRKRARENWRRVVGKVMLRNRLRANYADEIEEERSEKKRKKRVEKVVVLDAEEGGGFVKDSRGQDAGRAEEPRIEDEYGLGEGRRRRRPRIASSSEEAEVEEDTRPRGKVPRNLDSDSGSGSSSDGETAKPPRKIPRNLGSSDSSSAEDSEPKIKPPKKNPRRLASSSDSDGSTKHADKRPKLAPDNHNFEDEDDMDDEWAGFGGGFLAE